MSGSTLIQEQDIDPSVFQQVLAKLEALEAAVAAGGSAVKSVQRGTISHSEKTGTATINAVDVTKSVVIYTGQIVSGANAQFIPALTLESSTQVKSTTYSSTNGLTVPYQVIEFA